MRHGARGVCDQQRSGAGGGVTRRAEQWAAFAVAALPCVVARDRFAEPGSDAAKEADVLLDRLDARFPGWDKAATVSESAEAGAQLMAFVAAAMAAQSDPKVIREWCEAMASGRHEWGAK